MATAVKRQQTLAARRQDLVHGTIRSIASLGYSNSTVQTICEAANVSRGLIGHYFDSKDALLIEAFRHLCDRQDAEMREAIRAAGDDPLARLLTATAVSFRSAARREDALVWLALCGVAPWNPPMTELYQTMYRRYRSWIERMMARAAGDRGLDIDPRRAALTYVQMVDGFWIGRLLDRQAYSLDEATEIVCDWLRSTFRDPKPIPRRRRAPPLPIAAKAAKSAKTSRKK